MDYILITVALMALLMAAMAVGVVFRGQELKGSCGGVGNPDDCLCLKNNTPNACDPNYVGDPANGAPNEDGVIVYGGS